MKRFSMGITVLVLSIIGLMLNWPSLSLIYVQALFLIMFLWSGIEFYIGGAKSFAGNSPSHLIVKINRMLWPLFVLYSWLDFRYSWSKIVIPTWLIIGLLILCLGGLLIRLWAVIHLGESFSYDLKCPEGKALVQTGPYRFVRHPSYLGICILSSFPSLIVGSLAGFIGMTVTTGLHIIYRLDAEEKILAAEFGEEFQKYKQKTYRMIPYIY